MTTVDDVARWLETFAPTGLAADWDNVGLLVGDRARPAPRIMTCLTITPPVVDEAVARRVDLIVSHHPLPFRPVKTITADSRDGKLLWRLASAGVSVYSPHTAFDSAAQGINQALADGLQLRDVAPLEPIAASADPTVGVGRFGRLAAPATLGEFTERVKRFLNLGGLDVVGSAERRISCVGIACGSAGELLETAIRRGCDCFVTGEARFHTALAAEAEGVALLLVGHFASERFGVERLAAALSLAFPTADVWPAQGEVDPLRRA